MKQIGNFGGSTTSGGTTAKETIAKVKTARETVTSSTTLQDDNDFVFAVKANKTYALVGSLFVSAPASGGLKWAFSVPSGTTGTFNQGSTFYNATTDGDITTGFADSSVCPIASNTGIFVSGIITTSSTAGNITFQWAQNASNATGTYIERGSTMILTEV